MIKICSIIISLAVLTGCSTYTTTPGYYIYGQVTKENMIIAPAYIKNQDGSMESAPSGTIYFGRTAPEPIYVMPYNRAYIQPQYKPSILQIKK